MEVRLPNVPEHMAPGLAKVAQFVALIFGLRVATSEMRCCPLGGRWVGEQPEVCMSQEVVARHLRTLCALGVLTHVGNVPRRPKTDKGTETTRLYALGVAARGGALRVPTRHELHRRIHPDPVGDEPTPADPEPHAELENLGAMFPA